MAHDGRDSRERKRHRQSTWRTSMNPFRPLARFVVHHPLYVIAFRVIATIAIVGAAPSLSSVTNSDQSSFLPSSAEFSKANALVQHAFPSSTNASATFVF